MPAFQVSGATGQAPTTVWFGAALPDRGLTLTMPGYYNSPTNAVIYITDQKAAYFITDYVPFNTAMGGGADAATIILGAAVAAPDGAFTANHLAETTVNNFHAMTTIFPDGGVSHYRRIAVIAKAAERTRMFVSICLKPIVNESGCRTVFDLAGGQIGVVNTRYGTDTSQGSNIFWTPISQSIQALGGGWYLCIMDVRTSVNITGHNLSVLIGPDAGSGTQAVDISYAGDGTSGINVWKASVLPPRAWSMQNIPFFNGMDSLAKFDLNNTKAPGFDFYMNYGDFPLHGGAMLTPLPASMFSISGSILTYNARGAGGAGKNVDMGTLSYLGGGNWLGNTWMPPAYIESGFAFETTRAPQSNGIGFYGLPAETLINNPASTYPSGTNTTTYSEIDFNEAQSAAGGNLGVLVLDSDFLTNVPHPGGQDSTQANRTGSYAAWNPVVTYHSGAKVGFNGQLYDTLVDPNLGHQPDLTVGVDWEVFTPPAGQPTAANTFIFDAQAQNTFGVLWIPDRSMYDPYDVGELVGFVNGHLSIRFLTGQVCVLSYALSQGFPRPFTGAQLKTYFTNVDRGHMPIVLGSGNGFTNLFIDFVKVTQ